ncbi:MAG: hypothetical protein BRD55_06405 [Bacteroidetes bacterium SW_9_63_38]|nr:MAG: hypothetical protein BRD55_06405 [Bacteroidetes bacterium SW_9_63_38]
MDHATTIAMARDLLGNGRAEDVMQMIDPLLEPVDAPAASTGQLLLHALRGQIEVVHRDHPKRALDRLPALSDVQELCTCVRAEVALWRGWAHARQPRAPRMTTRALHRLQHAEELFDSVHDPRGRSWALLGQAQAYERLGEYALLRQTLSPVEDLRPALNDRLLDRWTHELSLPAFRSAGRYDETGTHLQALRAIGEDWQDRQIQGTAHAHDAALRLALGQSPSDVIDTADTAVSILIQADRRVKAPLVTAHRAHADALLRLGNGTEAREVLNDAADHLPDVPVYRAPFRLLRARIALRTDDPSTAAALDTLRDDADHLPHGHKHAPLALLRGELQAHDHNLDAAYTWMQRAYRNASETGHRGRQVRALLKMARTAAARSDLDTARTHLTEAERYDDLLSTLPVAARRFAAEGAVAQSAGDADDATDAYRHALAAATTMNDRYRTASLQLALAQLEHDDRAHALAVAAQSTFADLDAPDEVDVATALAEGAGEGSPDATARPHPPAVPSDAALAVTLRRASLSVPMVANAWLQTVAGLLPDRWLGVCRLSSDRAPELLHERGDRPDGLQWPTDAPAPTPNGPADWVRLHDDRPTLALGVEVDRTEDPDWDAAQSRLRLWRPLLRLALNRAQDRQSHPQYSPPATDASLPDDLVAQSPAMATVVDKMRSLRTNARPILITGERGTGKRRLARALHDTGLRAEAPLRHVACETMQQAPLPERLFGTVDDDGTLVPGAVHEADGGTLLIEDVNALPTAAQDTLLHLLDTGGVVPTNGTTLTPVDVRVIATTDDALDAHDDALRPALRESLSALSLRMPPLRERRADIPLLVRHFLDTLPPEPVQTTTSAAVTHPAMEALLHYDWPGNVRQLRNELERVLVHIESEPVQTIDRTMLLDRIVEGAGSDTDGDDTPPDAILHPDRSLSDVLSQTEKTMIERVLQACEGQVTASADVLGLSRQGLYKKMKRLGIDASDFQPDPAPTSS